VPHRLGGDFALPSAAAGLGNRDTAELGDICTSVRALRDGCLVPRNRLGADPGVPPFLPFRALLVGAQSTVLNVTYARSTSAPVELL
jgi:hypothetical protein